MPWEARSIVWQRGDFVALASVAGASVSGLAARSGLAGRARGRGDRASIGVPAQRSKRATGAT